MFFTFKSRAPPPPLVGAILMPLLVKLNRLDNTTKSHDTMPPPHTPYLFYGAVGERMCGHVKEQEVLLLCREHTFLDQVFCQTLSNISELVVQLQGIPGLS